MREDPQSFAESIALNHYGLSVKATQLVGELDLNFKLTGEEGNYLLKISAPDADPAFFDFQLQLMRHVGSDDSLSSPELIPNKEGNYSTSIIDDSGDKRHVRLLTWMDGRLWSSVNPINEKLRYSLGEQAGLLTKALQGFDHESAHRHFEWDLAQAEWTLSQVSSFTEQQQKIVVDFQIQWKEFQSHYSQLRKSVIHNDVNDNNIIVSYDLVNPNVVSIIDYGDAIHTQTINDLAITLAYGIMNVTDPLEASKSIISGYHSAFPLLEKELRYLYVLVAMRLIISVTKSAINKKENPENEYLQISEKPAWELLIKWYEIGEKLAHYTFRDACGFEPHPDNNAFHEWSKKQSVDIADLFPTLKTKNVGPVDMSIGSQWLGHTSEFSDNKHLDHQFHMLRSTHPDSVNAGGYLEPRPIYSTEAYQKESNNGPTYRTVHLGVDFWVEAGTPVHSVIDGRVFAVHNNVGDKDYGPTIILEHPITVHQSFFSLYGHLSSSSLDVVAPNQEVKAGELIGYIGDDTENGNWAPHLHFQLMLDMLGNTHDFPGVSYPKELSVWKSICPDPNLLFKRKELKNKRLKSGQELTKFRKKHLGKSLSLSYEQPLKILRGEGAYLIDDSGRRYLDTVNNVAHVGHEHPRVVKAGQEQLSVLNTNTRYLHPKINEFAEELLSTFPKELSVVHFVNSGSEANELAIRMAKSLTNQKDFIAVEVGYHGNTNANIDISSYKFDSRGGKGAPKHTHIVPLPDTFRGKHQGNDQGAVYASYVQTQIDNIQTLDRGVAAFICESIISCGGQIELPEGYLKEVYNLVRAADGLCIADEVQVGCGRVGSHFWGFELHDVVPDIVTIGKPIGNGHPLAAVVCTQEVADAFANGMEYFNTFGGNPVSSAIGHEVLQVINDEKLQENASNTGNYLKQQLRKLQSEFPIIGNVRGKGLFLGFELCDSNKNPLPDQTDYLINRMKELGILMSSDGPDHNVLKIKPPMVFSRENADELISRLKSVLKEDFMLDYLDT